MNDDIELMKRENHINEFVDFVMDMIRESAQNASEDEIAHVRGVLEVAKVTQMSMLRLEAIIYRGKKSDET